MMNDVSLAFIPSARPHTLGVELEPQVLDGRTMRLTPRAPEILASVQDARLAKEMFRSTIEPITGICTTAREAVDDLSATLLNVRKVSDALGLRFAGTGTHPLADYNDRLVMDSERYQQLLDRNQWLIRRMAVYGLHVHVGLPSGDACIRYMNAFLHLVPHLIALSASSPFWRGVDTGLCASRPTVYEAHPTSGLPVLVRDWSEFNMVYNDMLRTGSINSMKDIWWDLRPSPGYGTLEIRICDGPATMAELGAITAYIQANAAYMRDEQQVEDGPAPGSPCAGCCVRTSGAPCVSGSMQRDPPGGHERAAASRRDRGTARPTGTALPGARRGAPPAMPARHLHPR